MPKPAPHLPEYSDAELALRASVARGLIDAPFRRPPAESHDFAFLAEVFGRPPHGLEVPFPQGLAPTPKPSAVGVPDPNKPLPKADVVVVTYTQAERRRWAT